MPGSGTDHYLVSAWNTILEALEHDESAAINLISVDFAKAFNTMDHGACVRAFQAKGATSNSIGMIRSFLTGRKMRVKVGDELSSPRPINGGSPQGTLLGNMLFIITTDSLGEMAGLAAGRGVDDEIEVGGTTVDGSRLEVEEGQDNDISPDDITINDQPIYMNESGSIIDESTIIHDPRTITYDARDERPPKWKETELKIYKYVDDFLGVEKVCTKEGIMTITQNKTEISTRAKQSEAFYRQVEKDAKEIGMSVNASKTQMLCISPALSLIHI